MNRTTLITLPLALALSACAGTRPRADEFHTRTEYVTVPCNAPAVARPSWAVDALPVGSRIDVQMRALRADRKAALGHITVLEAALDACRTETKLP